MNWQEFEDRLGAEAQDHRTPVDTDALWTKIREKKQFGWRRFFGSLLALSLLIGYGWWATVNFRHPTPFPSPEIGASDPTGTIVHAPSPAPDRTGSDSDTAARKVDHPLTFDPSAVPTKNPVLVGPKFKSSVKASSHHLGKHTAVIPNKPLFQQKQKRGKPKTQTKGLIPVEPGYSSAPGSTKAIQETGNDPEGTTEALARGSGNDALLSGSVKPVTLPFLACPFIPLIAEIPDRPSPLAFAAVIATLRKSNPVYIGLQAGYFSWQSRSAANGLSTRSGEKNLAALQTALQVQWPLRRDWSLRAGLQYTVYQSVFRWTRRWEAFDTAAPILNYYLNGNIDTTFGIGLSRYERKVQHYNRLQSMAIPLDLQYRLALRSWSLRPSAGLQVQLWQRADGVVLQTSAPDPQAYRSIYRQAFSLGLRFGISLEAPLGPKTRLVLEPAGMLDLHRRSAPDYPAEYFRQWGINLGVVRQW